MREGRKTLTRYTIESEHRHPGSTGEFSGLLNAVATAVKIISNQVSRGALAGAAGSTGVKIVQGEAQKKLDLISNEVMIGETEWTGYLAAIASAETEHIYPVPDTGRRGKYLLETSARTTPAAAPTAPTGTSCTAEPRLVGIACTTCPANLITPYRGPPPDRTAPNQRPRTDRVTAIRTAAELRDFMPVIRRAAGTDPACARREPAQAELVAVSAHGLHADDAGCLLTVRHGRTTGDGSRGVIQRRVPSRGCDRDGGHVLHCAVRHYPLVMTWCPNGRRSPRARPACPARRWPLHPRPRPAPERRAAAARRLARDQGTRLRTLQPSDSNCGRHHG